MLFNRIIDASLRHRGVVLVLAVVLVVTGLASFHALPIDALPDVTDVMVQVNTIAPALGPEEVEQISARVEQAMGGLPELRLVRSMSKFGLSQVTLVFEDGTDLHFARSLVLERLQSVDLPPGIERPSMGPIATGLGEIFHYVVTSVNGDLTDARTIHDWVIKPQLLSVPGVAEVNAWGGFERQFHVVVDPVRLVKHGLTLTEVLEALDRSNANVGGGVVHASGEILLVHGVGTLTSLVEIGGVTIATRDGRAVRIRDVADVVEGHETRRGVVTHEGRGEAVLGLGFMLMGENSHAVADRLRKRLDEVRAGLPANTHVRVVYDRTHLVDLVIDTVKENLFEGALLVVAVLFVFLGRVRVALVVASTIPLSMLFATNVMLRAGIAGTLMSFGAIDFGMVVDSSVILVENAVRRLREDTTGRPVVDVVADAAKEVRAPTMFGEIIILIVYVPILALYGVEGKLFAPMAWTVIFALTGALLLSLTVVPVLASLLLTRRAGDDVEPWLVRALDRVYAPAVGFCLRNRVLTLGCALIVAGGAVPLALGLGSVFLPEMDEGSIVINTIRLPGVSIEESARFSTEIERLLKKEFPDEIDSVWTRTGTPEVATDPMGIEVSDVFLMLTPRERWKRAATKGELEREMDRVLRRLPGMNYAFTQPIEMRFNEMIAGVRTDLGVKIFGDDFTVLKEKAAKVEALLRTIDGAAQPMAEPIVGLPVLQVKLDLEALSRHGLKARDVLDVVEAAGGKVVGEVRQDQRRFPLAVRLPDRYLDAPERFGTIGIAAPDGQRLALSALARVERVSGPLVVNREWGKRRVVVTTNVTGRDLGGFVSEVKRRIDSELGADLKAAGCRVEYGGQYENLVRATNTLLWVVPLAVALIVFLVYATYGNVLDTLRIFTSVPFGWVGGVLALWVRDMPFSVAAGVGFVALSGVSMLDDMVMVSAIRQRIAEGLDMKEAVLGATRRRLRPVLMTALLGALGFLPMALNTGVGAEVQRPLATVVIGGLISSTLLTMFVLPTLFLTLRARGAAAAGGARE